MGGVEVKMNKKAEIKWRPFWFLCNDDLSNLLCGKENIDWATYRVWNVGSLTEKSTMKENKTNRVILHIWTCKSSIKLTVEAWPTIANNPKKYNI